MAPTQMLLCGSMREGTGCWLPCQAGDGSPPAEVVAGGSDLPATAGARPCSTEHLSHHRQGSCPNSHRQGSDLWTLMPHTRHMLHATHSPHTMTSVLTSPLSPITHQVPMALMATAVPWGALQSNLPAPDENRVKCPPLTCSQLRVQVPQGSSRPLLGIGPTEAQPGLPLTQQ